MIGSGNFGEASLSFVNWGFRVDVAQVQVERLRSNQASHVGRVAEPVLSGHEVGEAVEQFVSMNGLVGR